QLHDTFGFPFDMTNDILESEGLTVDQAGFEELMEQQRTRARSGAKSDSSAAKSEVVETFARDSGAAAEFVGYEHLQHHTHVTAVAPAADPSSDALLIKLAQSPFYAEGGGQVSDSGTLTAPTASGTITAVYRIGDDQVLSVVPSSGTFEVGMEVSCSVERNQRFAIATHHTATHLLHAALRERLGTHVRQAGSAVRPDKLRFDFTHGQGMSPDDIEWVEDRVNGWIAENHSVYAIQTTRDEAETLGAMALFGEKYGDWVRMVSVGQNGTAVSRELCGGTHVASTGEIGVFTITTETSSAANVRRIEALAGPAAAAHLRERDKQLRAVAQQLKARPEEVAAAVQERESKLKQLQKAGKGKSKASDDVLNELEQQISEISGVRTIFAQLSGVDDAQIDDLRALADRVRDKFSTPVVVLGAGSGDNVQLVVGIEAAVIERGVKAGALAKIAAGIVGGGGGGRDNMAQAGGKDPAKLGEALQAVREAVSATLAD
ncbi:MAG: hypothetical protein JHC87_10230, partial [Thermoleophilaceae bacterium]|nr:hypothetical protein [Thermoleophilaceae bacterium]